MNNLDWQFHLKGYLMSAGMQGRKQMDIFKRFPSVMRDEIVLELEALWAEQLVQRFTFTAPKAIVWRATDKMNV